MTVLLARSLVVSICAVSLLSACATIRGSQNAPPELQPNSQATAMNDALRTFYSDDDSDRDGLSPEAYRNLTIREYSQRIDARYNAFVDQLNAGDRGTALGFDLAQLGISGATVLAEGKAVDTLATIGTVAAGARASIDKRVFFDRTITALVASMDAERSLVKAEIARKRRLSANEYTLDDAFDDLNILLDAGNVNRALSRIGRNAEADRTAAKARLDGVSAACDDIPAEDADLRYEFRQFLDKKSGNVTLAASVMGVDLPHGQNPKAVLRDVLANKYCGVTAKRELLDRLGSTGG